MPKRLSTSLVFSLFLYSSVFSQTTERRNQPSEAWLSTSLFAFLGERHILHSNLIASYSPATTKLRFSNALPLYQVNGQLTYAFRASKNWLLGSQLQVTSRPEQNGRLLGGAFLGHLGQLGPVFLYKSVGVSWVSPRQPRADSFGKLDFRGAMVKELRIGGVPFRAELSGLLSRNFGSVRNENTRRINLSEIQTKFIYRYSENWWLGFFAVRQSQYLFLIGSGGRFNAAGEQIAPPRPARNLNHNTPIFGLSLQYLINPENRPLLQW